MKILTFDKPANPDAKPITFQLWLDEDVKGQVAQQITIAHYNESNPAWVRHVQATNQYFVISRPGSTTAGFHVDDLIKMLVDGIPEISYAPVFRKPVKDVAISEGETAILTFEVGSELPVTYQWQQFDGKEWQNCDGQDRPTIQTKGLGSYQLKATNTLGESFSKPVNVTKK